ncbi:M23 family metallopeptidase [Paenibacillus hexagrammi]|uniref:M23 family metallopeptidase n=1 Tax=Paenibacillus hexagrammi TaxID=2908839 RepID=A0ABY3SK27_9BACL|nr:M23 family metallopeptidase [Paenibacillus sp. YPD9-1]UJF34202.1 M23 family metallopeptidase [Paenibacillus sp. YPD9-1]
MKFIWGKKELTLMIIPGANRRTVRIKLPQSSLYIVPSVILLVLIGFLVAIHLMNIHFRETKDTMQQTFDGQERQLVDQITLKDSELEQLQNNLIDLSQQADDFKGKLEEIKKLNHVVQLMSQTGGTSKNSQPSGVTTDVGGEDVPVSSEQVSQMVTDTKQDLTSLVGDINVLLADLTESESKLQEAERIREITPTLWPIDSHTITSDFGVRRDPFTQKPTMHTGIDFDGELNDPVYATAAGKVIEAGYDDQHGNHIIIDHSRGLQTEYMHMNKLLLRRGDTVVKGQKIGLVGTTGRSTGTHLHYEVHRNGVQINPYPYLLTNRKGDR